VSLNACVCICVRERERCCVGVSVSVCVNVQNTNAKKDQPKCDCQCVRVCVCVCVCVLFLKERKHGTSIMLPSGTLAYSGILGFKFLSTSVGKGTFECETKHKSRKIRTVKNVFVVKLINIIKNKLVLLRCFNYQFIGSLLFFKIHLMNLLTKV
jgi:hypothetical protein